MYPLYPYVINKTGMLNNIPFNSDTNESYNFQLYNEFLQDSGKF